MSDPKRVVKRYRQAGNVVQLAPNKPKGPTLAIGGRHYALSDYWPAMDVSGPSEEGGARLIDTGGGGKYRYLWAYDTDNGMVGMWRVSDGDEKAHDRASHFTSTIYALDKKGQMNRVDHAEFSAIYRYMHHKAEETLQSLKRMIEENATDWDKRVSTLLDGWFKHHVKPELDRRMAELKSGVIPFGFKVDERMLAHKSAEAQARVFLIGKVFQKFNQDAAYDFVSKETGVDAWQPPNGDGQAVEWAYHEIVEKTYDAYR